MRWLTNAEMNLVRLSVEENDWKHLIDWWANVHNHTYESFEVSHRGFTTTDFPDDSYYDKYRGVETTLGNVISVWTGECLNPMMPYYIELSTGRYLTLSKSFASRSAMEEWLDQDQPFCPENFPR